MKNKSQIANFACLRYNYILFIHHLIGHKSHRKCIAHYLNTENGRKSRFLCPLRCSEVYNV